MINLYQTEWHGIKFSSFAKTSSKNLAKPEFYNAFYRALFQKYAGYECLDAGWRSNKTAIADWLATRIPKGARVLSVGCGLGFMEQHLWREYGDRFELHVQDYATDALRWLRQVMPADHIHEAEGAEQWDCKTQNERYDFIYLSAVDYALSDDELVALLFGILSYLREDGKVVMTSASFLDEYAASVGPFGKAIVKWLLERLGLYERGQFWGWCRTRRDYQRIMRAAGFSPITDGFVETPDHQRTYWISGEGVTTA